MGYKEISHTADLALSVWGIDIESFFIDAAKGMYSYMGIQPNQTNKETHSVSIEGDDIESLLVTFLSELLFKVEIDRSYFDRIILRIENQTLNAQMDGFSIQSLDKQIKAVTYHNLQIYKSKDQIKAEIVFDV